MVDKIAAGAGDRFGLNPSLILADVERLYGDLLARTLEKAYS